MVFVDSVRCNYCKLSPLERMVSVLSLIGNYASSTLQIDSSTLHEEVLVKMAEAPCQLFAKVDSIWKKYTIAQNYGIFDVVRPCYT